MSNLNLRTPNTAKLLQALQIATGVVQQCAGDGELLQLVVQQLAASSGVSLTTPAANSNQKSGSSSGRRGGRRSRRSSRSRSRGGSPGPQEPRGGGNAQAQPQPQAQGPPPVVNNNNAPQPGANPAAPLVQPVAQQRPLVDITGTMKSTWKNRIKGARQRALESHAALKQKATQRTAAICCNAWWTLNEQTTRFRQTPFWTRNTADPMRDLPSADAIGLLATVLDASQDPVWKRDVENNHFVLQDDEGRSLRGEDVFTRYFN